LHGQLDVRSGTHTFAPVGKLSPPAVELAGTWNVAADKVTAAAPGALIVLGMHAQSVNVVLAPPAGEKSAEVLVELDGQPVPAAERGANVHLDPNGRTVVNVTAPDMYRIVAANGVEDHQLTVIAEQPGVEAYSFTFG
jgi:hypothetical protein